jgi:hypothetical protein
MRSRTPMKKSGVQRLQRYRRFYLPFVYGLATANFVAVIQLISAPQLNVRWEKLIAPETSELLSCFGFCGMTMMTASIPILIGFAVYTELALRKRHYTRFPVRALTYVAVLGMIGPGITFVAFHAVFGIAYLGSMMATMWAMDKAIARFEARKNSNKGRQTDNVDIILGSGVRSVRRSLTSRAVPPAFRRFLPALINGRRASVPRRRFQTEGGS